MSKLQIKGAKSINAKIIDELRESRRPNKKAAKSILTKHKSPKGFRIVCTQTRIDKEIEKRVKRWGNTAAMWWNAAKEINPKIKKDKLPKAKTKRSKKQNGTISISKGSGITAKVYHFAESKNKKFASKLKKHIAREEKFWSGVAGKQIVASKFLKKMIET